MFVIIYFVYYLHVNIIDMRRLKKLFIIFFKEIRSNNFYIFIKQFRKFLIQYLSIFDQ